MQLPFQLDFSDRESLAEQLATGLTLAIHRGVYRSGERLPTVRGLAGELKVSESVVRGAYRRLTEAGEIVGRTRLGSVVCPAKGATWRGRVLIVMSDFDFNPQMCVHLAKLRSRLQNDGYSVGQAMALLDASRKRDFRGAEIALRQGADFIVLLHGAADIERFLATLNIPFCVVGNSEGEYLPPGCVGRIGVSSKEAVDDLAKRCLQRGVRTAEIVATNAGNQLSACVESALRSVNICVRRVRVRDVYCTERRFDSAFDCGFRMAKSRLASHSPLPDFVFVADDFVGTGYLHALTESGVAVPDDVGFACYSNEGFGPYFTRPVTVLQAENYATGDLIASIVSNHLCRHRDFPNISMKLRFVPGETL